MKKKHEYKSPRLLVHSVSFMPIALEIKVSQAIVDDEAVKDRFGRDEELTEEIHLITEEDSKPNHSLW